MPIEHMYQIVCHLEIKKTVLHQGLGDKHYQSKIIIRILRNASYPHIRCECLITRNTLAIHRYSVNT